MIRAKCHDPRMDRREAARGNIPARVDAADGPAGWQRIRTAPISAARARQAFDWVAACLLSR
jgi:hypothetical protein